MSGHLHILHYLFDNFSNNPILF